MKKETIPQPYAVEMTYDENCWLVIDCRTSDNPYVSYYNPKQDKDEEFETIKSFAEFYFDNELLSFEDRKIEYKENLAVASGSSATESEDFDEDSKRVWKSWVGDGQLVKVVTGVKQENIGAEVAKVVIDLKEMEKEAAMSAKDSDDESSDPYGYRGLRRSDFF